MTFHISPLLQFHVLRPSFHLGVCGFPPLRRALGGLFGYVFFERFKRAFDYTPFSGRPAW
jgi:hypothetical protein